MSKYGIIGQPLEHSFSAKWFNTLFMAQGIEAEYKEYEQSPEDVLSYADLDGFNVTHPYKQTILPLLSEVDAVAQEIGAVNTVCRVGKNKYKGYNTDWIGFSVSLSNTLNSLSYKPQRAYILGTGGAAKAVAYALKAMGIGCDFVSRSSQRGVPYSALDELMVSEHLLIINCTPLGMYPAIDSFPPFPYDFISSRHILFDCIYNPSQTVFLSEGAKREATCVNGYEMLVEQAKAAWQIWR